MARPLGDPVLIRLVEDFSKYPAGRYLTDGPFPGEGFRNLILAALKKDETVTIALDGAAGYGSGFLEEAFGGLVREGSAADFDVGRSGPCRTNLVVH